MNIQTSNVGNSPFDADFKMGRVSSNNKRSKKAQLKQKKNLNARSKRTAEIEDAKANFDARSHPPLRRSQQLSDKRQKDKGQRRHRHNQKSHHRPRKEKLSDRQRKQKLSDRQRHTQRSISSESHESVCKEKQRKMRKVEIPDKDKWIDCKQRTKELREWVRQWPETLDSSDLKIKCESQGDHSFAYLCKWLQSASSSEYKMFKKGEIKCHNCDFRMSQLMIQCCNGPKWGPQPEQSKNAKKCVTQWYCGYCGGPKDTRKKFANYFRDVRRQH